MTEYLLRFSTGTARNTAKPAIQKKKRLTAPIHYEKHSSWFLRKNFGFCEGILLLNSCNSIISILQRLKKVSADRNRASPINTICPTPDSKAKMIDKCVNLAIENQKMLTCFRALARRWLLKRIKNANEEDLVTGEAPKKLVTVLNWSDRRKYVFEAGTILRDMTNRILHHNYLFAKFLLPRNPYTNIDFTQGQFFSIITQLRDHKMTNWIVEGLYAMQYSMVLFKEKFADAVKREIIDRQFKNVKSEDTIDLLMEFIADQHSSHERTLNRPIYLWVMQNLEELPSRMQFWLTMCKMYYIVSATITDPGHLGAELNRIEGLTKKFCGVPHDLIAKREMHFKVQLLRQRAEQPTAEQPTAEQPIAEQPIAEQPIAEQPIAEQPTAEQLLQEKQLEEMQILQDLITQFSFSNNVYTT